MVEPGSSDTDEGYTQLGWSQWEGKNEPFTGAGASIKLCLVEVGASLRAHAFPVTNDCSE